MDHQLCADAEGFGPFSIIRDFDFTPCFEDLVIIPLPHFLLVLFSIFRFIFLARFPRQQDELPKVWLCWVKWVFFIMAIALSAAVLALKSLGGTEGFYAVPTGGLLIAAILSHLQFTRARRASFILTAYYIFVILASAIRMRTMITTMAYRTDGTILSLFVAQVAVIIALLVLEQVPLRVIESGHNNKYQNINMEKTSGPLSQLVFQWMQPLMKLGFRKHLLPGDLYPLSDCFTPRRNYEHFAKRWESEKRKPQPSLRNALFLSFGWPYTLPLILKLMGSSLTFAQPQLLRMLLEFIQSYQRDAAGNYISTPMSLGRGIIISVIMFSISISMTLCNAWFFKLACDTGFKIRAALITTIYRKSLRLSPGSRRKVTTGEITNHMSVDAEAIYNAAPDVCNIVDVLFQICLALYFLYLEISWAIFAGLGVILLVIPLQFLFGAFWNTWQKGKMQSMDTRIRLMNEIIAGMKIVKLYAWEQSFIKKVTEVRTREVKFIQTIGRGFSIITIVFTCAPFFISLACFGVYTAIAPNGDTLNSTKLFVCLTLLQILQPPIGNLGSIMSRILQALVAYKRLAKFLVFEEINDTITRLPSTARTIPRRALVAMHHKKSYSAASLKSLKDLLPMNDLEVSELDYSVIIKEGEFTWALDESSTLQDINLSIVSGSLVAVVGRVGQGKTSLISAILGDMYKTKGSVMVRGKVAYVPQQAWIMNATIRDNIVFGSEFDVAWYNQVIDACSLRPDFDMLPAGDLTEIGERGINLSGGQRQRVSLARAVYSRADVYLLDDPLSAVDAHVDRHLFDYAIGPHGLLKEKTRILVTNAIHHSNEVDQIVVVKKGHVVEEGNFPTLMENRSHFYNLMTKRQSSRMSSLMLNPGSVAEAMKKFAQEEHKQKEATEKTEQDMKIGLLTTEEFRAEGKVTFDVYMTYLKAATIPYSLAFLIAVFSCQAVAIGSRYWLQDWSDRNITANVDIGFNLSVYASFIVIYASLAMFASFVGMAIAAVRAARTLQKKLLHKVFRLPMSFFDTTPLGRIVNRFSKDVQTIDENLPLMIQNYFFHFTNVLGTVVVISITTPIFLAMVPFIVYAFYWIQKYYLHTSRALKRLESTSRSPIYAHFSETLGGISSIRAYNVIDQFVSVNEERAKYNQNAFYLWVQSNRWLQMRIEFISAFIVFGSAIFACLYRETLSPGVVGLAVSYALSITLDITMIVRYYCDIETNIVSVERIKEYLDLQSEAADETAYPLAPKWPQKGIIEFRNYAARYREDTDLVLKGISFKVEPGEKVGIVGRTGAGKSSLTLALFRIIEAAPIVEQSTTPLSELLGSIEIDGVDISKLGLRTLRSSLSIIPQEPVLFVGTVRENLDPFGEHDDLELWQALEGANLKNFIDSMDGGLSMEVSQGGDNFSVGQRQLICLARALLRKTSILVLDEATGSIDAQTDEIIQETIRREFKNRTVITIAHRIGTIMDSDKILVLERGKVAEFAPPRTLLHDRHSLFYGLAHQAGELDDDNISESLQDDTVSSIMEDIEMVVSKV